MGAEMMVPGVAERGTVPQTVVNLQEEVNRTAEPMTFQGSAHEVSADTEKKYWSWKVRLRL